MPDGNTNWPTDAAGQTAVGMDIGGNKYYLYGDNSTAKNLKTALYDSTGTALLSSANPAYVTAAGITAQVSATPTVSTSPAYSAGDLVGTKMTFANAVRASGGTAILQTLVVTDLAKQDAALDLIIFDSDPNSTTFTDNAAFDVADADLTKIVAVVKLTSTDYADFNDSSVACRIALGAAVKASGSTSLYGALVARGTPTYSGTTDVKVVLTALQD